MSRPIVFRYMSALAMGTSKTTHNITLQAIVTGGTLTDLISHTGTTDISKIIHSWAGGYYWSSAERLKMMTDHSGASYADRDLPPHKSPQHVPALYQHAGMPYADRDLLSPPYPPGMSPPSINTPACHLMWCIDAVPTATAGCRT